MNLFHGRFPYDFPDLFQIEIGVVKIRDYLLNLQHPDGGSKAKFFMQQGFTTEEEIKAVLLSIIQQNEIKDILPTAFGMKYDVEVSLSANSRIRLRTVWIVLKGENSCRFVIANPL